MGPGREKIDNLGGLTVKVRTGQHNGGEVSSRVTFPGVFVWSGSFILPGHCVGVASVRKAVTWVQGRIPLHAKNGVFVLRTWEPEEA